MNQVITPPIINPRHKKQWTTFYVYCYIYNHILNKYQVHQHAKPLKKEKAAKQYQKEKFEVKGELFQKRKDSSRIL